MYHLTLEYADRPLGNATMLSCDFAVHPNMPYIILTFNIDSYITVLPNSIVLTIQLQISA